jgi:hypothetical protein
MRGVYRVLVGKPQERNHLEDPDVDGSDNIKMVLQEVGWWEWTGSICPRIGTGGGLL